MNWLRLLLVMALATGVAACSSSRKGGYYEDDGPPDRAIDVGNIPDATPRQEPPSKTGNKPYVVFGKSYVPLASAKGFRQKGVASWYGKKFHGRRTSSGETYDMYAMTAAHTVLPIPSYARVTNLANGRSVLVRVNDRGPFKSNRVMDLSYAAAYRLDMLNAGTALVEIVVIEGDTATPRSSGNRPAVIPTERPDLYIQVGAFSNQDAARVLQSRLRQSGFDGVFITEISRKSLRLYRVRLGPLAGIDNADLKLAELHRSGFSEARYVIESKN